MNARHAPPGHVESLCAQVLERARAHGAQVADACAESSRSFTVRVHGGAVDTLKQSGTMGVGVRAIVDGAVGFASGTDLTPAGLDDLARRAVALARFATPDEANGALLPEETGGEFTGDQQLFDAAALELPVELKIEMALELERLALAADRRVTPAAPSRTLLRQPQARRIPTWRTTTGRRQRLECGRRVCHREHARGVPRLGRDERVGVGGGAGRRSGRPSADRSRGHERAAPGRPHVVGGDGARRRAARGQSHRRAHRAPVARSRRVRPRPSEHGPSV